MKMMAKFSKTGDLKYCSHLDLQNLFMRGASRAKIPVQFSQGFNRHANLSIAMALGVGQESVSEYMEFELEKEISEYAFKNAMNNALPKDVQIMDCRLVKGKMPALMSLVYAAEYAITFKDETDLQKKTDEILSKSVIMIEKKTKSKNEPTDIRPMIIGMSVKDNVLTCTVRCGSVNLKPKDVIGLYGEGLNCNILRTRLLSLNNDGRLVELMDV